MERTPDLLILTINYFPEPAGFAPHVTAFCEDLVAQGKRVTVLTGFPFAPYWKRWPEYRGRFRAIEQRGGVEIIRNTHFIPASPRRLLQRILMESSFCASVLWTLVRLRLRAPVLIYVGAQPSIAMLCRIVAAVTGARYGVMINDLATGAANDVGIVKSRWLGRALHLFEFSAYRGAAGATVLCDAFKRALIAEGYPDNRVMLVRSPVNTQQIRPVRSDQMTFRARLGFVPGDFIVLFAGSMGLKQGLENVIRAARLLRDESPQIKWVLVGEGEMRSTIEEQIQVLDLGASVRVIPFQPVEEMSDMFSSADLLILNQLATVKDTVIPSKLLTYMAAGRPVIASVNAASQGAELLALARGGHVVPPENPAALAQAVRNMTTDTNQLAAMGRANRAFAVEHFDQHRIMQQLAEFVRKLCSPTPAS